MFETITLKVYKRDEMTEIFRLELDKLYCLFNILRYFGLLRRQLIFPQYSPVG